MDRRRVDALEASGHARWAALDLLLLRSLGIRTVREALRWHLIEKDVGVYDWSSARAQIDGALAADAEVIWDICHWGVPDGMDIMSAEWPSRLARLAGAAARMLRREGVRIGGWVPVNEMAFWAWTGGQTGGFAPFLRLQGDAFKRQLVAGHLAVVEALREAGATEPIIVCEPLIWVVEDPAHPASREYAAQHMAGALTAIDMILERDPAGIHVLGWNFYPHNQWQMDGTKVVRGDPRYRPLRALLQDMAQRYELPMAITETGAEEPEGVVWTDYAGEEIAAARQRGVPLLGVCLYPVMDYRGWDNARHCRCGPIGINGEKRFIRPAQRDAISLLTSRLGAAICGP
jgi:beta-glucosidase/6-phospho-beta-glucosidase/beta-galactosidase